MSDQRPTLEEIAEKYGLAGIHPAAALFPMMTDEEHAALVADVREHGFTTHIVVTDDDLLLDGRNRLLASWDAELDVGIRRFTPTSPVQYVMSENLHRRHLTTGQKAMVGLDALPLLEAEARERMAMGGRSAAPGRPSEKGVAELPQVLERAPLARDRAADLVGTSGRAVAQAKRVEQQAPDLAVAVRAGTLALDAAEKETKKRAAAQAKDQPAEPKPAPTSATTLTLLTHDNVEVPYPKPKARSTFNPTNEHISWAAWSWNPVTGCLHGCEYCYARELATKESFATSYPIGFTPLFHHERLDAPANTKVPADAEIDPRRKRVFVCSMADLYGQWVPDTWIEAVHAACIDNPQWDYLTLTKFPSRYLKVTLPPTAWIGTSVDEQRRVAIAEHVFRNIENVRVRWLSLEPLRAPLQFTDLSMFDWIVIGSQTQTVQPTGVVPAFAPPFDWVARIVAQAREAGVAVYLKPNLLGETNPQAPGMELPHEIPR